MINIELRPAIDEHAGETLAISSRAMQTIVRLPFGPPFCSGTQSCISPISPNSFTISVGKRSVSSISAAIGATCLATILRMPSRKAVCSSVKLMDGPVLVEAKKDFHLMGDPFNNHPHVDQVKPSQTRPPKAA